MLEGFIRSKTARKILTILVANPDEKFYVRQLERLTEEPVSAVQRELRKLDQSGFLSSKDEARVKYYWINKGNPIFAELKSIIFKTQGIGDYLRVLMKDMDKIQLAFIYGSVARGEENANSDIDLMVIGGIDGVELHRQMDAVEQKIQRAIQYTLLTPRELKAGKSDFIKRVLKDKKIFVVGSEDELRKTS